MIPCKVLIVLINFLYSHENIIIKFRTDVECKETFEDQGLSSMQVHTLNRLRACSASSSAIRSNVYLGVYSHVANSLTVRLSHCRRRFGLRSLSRWCSGRGMRVGREPVSSIELFYRVIGSSACREQRSCRRYLFRPFCIHRRVSAASSVSASARAYCVRARSSFHDTNAEMQPYGRATRGSIAGHSIEN